MEDQTESSKKHFNMKEIVEYDNMTKSKRKRKLKKQELKEISDDFEVKHLPNRDHLSPNSRPIASIRLQTLTLSPPILVGEREGGERRREEGKERERGKKKKREKER
mgnify:CR=1 FL=1